MITHSKKQLNSTLLFLILSLFTTTWIAAYADNRAFITTWRTTAANETITIPTDSSSIYDYTLNCGSDSTTSNPQTGVAGNGTCTYPTAGDHTVTITGSFPRIYFNYTGDKTKIRSVRQWGTQAWTSMGTAFFGATNLNINATDAPNLSGVTNMFAMFAATTFNQPLSDWDVSKVTDMSYMFYGASVFNSDISGWNVSSATSMNGMFSGANAFNQNLGKWYITPAALTLSSGATASITAQNAILNGQNPIYDLVVGEGDADNDEFTITAGILTRKGTAAAKRTYKVRLGSTSSFGTDNERAITITDRAVPIAVCDRTAQVRDRIVAATAGITNCADITDAHLKKIPQLNSFKKGITSLKDGDFDGLSALTNLSFFANSIRNIPAGIFEDLSNLKQLNIANNELTTLPSGIFDNLTKLQKLFIGNNNFTTLPDGIFDQLTTLKVLSMNGIKGKQNIFTTGMFDRLTALQELSLSSGGGKLTSLPAGIFDQLTALQKLRLQENQLTALASNIFDNLTELTVLNLQNNRLTNLDAGIFSTLTKLHTLRIDSNQIISLSPIIFFGLGELTTLSVDRLAPTGLTNTATTDNSISLSWTAPPLSFSSGFRNTITGFVIEQSTTGATGSFTVKASTETAATTATISELTAATQYHYRVIASINDPFNSTANSPASALLAITTSAAPIIIAPSITASFAAITATAGTPITDIRFTNTGGAVTTWVISPDISNGLEFDDTNGIIHGTPTAEASAQIYTITAANSSDDKSAQISITVASAFNLDIDGSGGALDATTDGFLIIQFMFNQTSINTTGLTTHRTHDEILSFLRSNDGRLDIDGSGGTLDASTDGILIIQFMVRPNAVNTSGFTTHRTHDEILQHLRSLAP